MPQGVSEVFCLRKVATSAIAAFVDLDQYA
jgi:hypothetical protein